MSEWIFFAIVVGISVTVISYLANKILHRPLKKIIGDWLDALFP